MSLREILPEPVWSETSINLYLTEAQGRMFKRVIIRGEAHTVEDFPGYSRSFNSISVEGVTPVVSRWVYALRQFAKESEERSDKTIATRLANSLEKELDDKYKAKVKNRLLAIKEARAYAKGDCLRTFLVELNPVQYGYCAVARTYSWGGEIATDSRYLTHYSTQYFVLPDTSDGSLKWAVGTDGAYLEMGSSDSRGKRKGTHFEDLDEAKAFAISLSKEASETLRLEDIEEQKRAIAILQDAGLGLED